MRIAVVALAGLLAVAGALAQDPAKVVTKADVEKVTGAKFKDGSTPMPTQIAFVQDGRRAARREVVVPHVLLR